MAHLRTFLYSALWICILSLGAIGEEITDDLGRKFQLPHTPERIVSLAPSLTESLFALGAGPRIVGVTDYCNYPDGVRQKTRVGGIINPSVETIISLRPDLAVVSSEANRFELIAQLERFHIPVLATRPTDWEGILQSLRLLGIATSTRQRAEELIAEMEHRRKTLQQKVEKLPHPKVLVLYDVHPPITGGQRSFSNAVIEAAGGQSISSSLQQDWPRLNLEFIIKQDPEYIFLVDMAPSSQAVDKLSSWPGWKQISAVRNKRVIMLDDRINHPSPRLVEMMELMARLIHPGVSLP